MAINLTGCASINYITNRDFADLTYKLEPPDLYFHGKAGRIMAQGGYYLAIPVDIVLLPITYPLSWALAEWVVGEGWAFVLVPGGIIQTSLYAVGTGVAYPVHLVVETVPEKLCIRKMTKDQTIKYIWNQRPYISESQYQMLVSAWPRTNAPQYMLRPTYAPFGIGTKARLDDDVVKDWVKWKGMPNQALEATPLRGSPQR